MLQAGMFDARRDRPGARYHLVAQRAARAIGDLPHARQPVHARAGRRVRRANTPRGWLRPRRQPGPAASSTSNLQQPAYGTSYLIGQDADRGPDGHAARQLGDAFTSAASWDDWMPAAWSACHRRWELTGERPGVPRRSCGARAVGRADRAIHSERSSCFCSPPWRGLLPRGQGQAPSHRSPIALPGSALPADRAARASRNGRRRRHPDAAERVLHGREQRGVWKTTTTAALGAHLRRGAEGSVETSRCRHPTERALRGAAAKACNRPDLGVGDGIFKSPTAHTWQHAGTPGRPAGCRLVRASPRRGKEGGGPTRLRRHAKVRRCRPSAAAPP